MFTQTAEQAEAKLLRFSTIEACKSFLVAHNIAAIPHPSKEGFIGIFFNDLGVFGVSSAATGELLPDW